MTASTIASAHEPTFQTGLNARQRLLLALILTGQFMAVLDASIVNVAIPTIRMDLHATGAELQLIVASYVIAYAVLLITGARLGQRFGFRRNVHLGPRPVHGRVARVRARARQPGAYRRSGDPGCGRGADGARRSSA